MINVKIWSTVFYNLTSIEPKEDWIEIELICLLCEPNIRLEREDLEYYIVQENQYRILFKYAGKTYNGHIEIDDIQ